MAYSVLFNMCLSDLRLHSFVYVCEYACLHLVGEGNVCCSSRSLHSVSSLVPLSSMHPLLLSAIEKVPGLHLYLFNGEFGVH